MSERDLHVFLTLMTMSLDFSGGPVVKNPLASAGDMALILGQGRFHMPSIPLSPRAATTEPMYHNH